MMSNSVSLHSADFLFDEEGKMETFSFMIVQYSWFAAYGFQYSTTTSSDYNNDFSCWHQSILATKPSEGRERVLNNFLPVETKLDADFQ